MKTARTFPALFLVMLAALSTPLSAQSNTVLDTYLDQPKADLATTVWLVYLASGVIPQDSTPARAMDLFTNSDTAAKLKTTDAADSVRFADFAWIVMDTMKLPGGVMFSIAPSPRYAAREFTFRRWIPGQPKPGALLSPWEVTTSLSEVLAWKEEREMINEK